MHAVLGEAMEKPDRGPGHPVQAVLVVFGGIVRLLFDSRMPQAVWTNARSVVSGLRPVVSDMDEHEKHEYRKGGFCYEKT